MDSILERLYKVDRPNQKREAPMSLICCGMPRTGTMSLMKALKILGYENVLHGSVLVTRPDIAAGYVETAKMKFNRDPRIKQATFWDRLLAEYQAIADLPAAAYIQELVAAYPEAKVVLNTRDVDSWMMSMQKALAFYLRGRHYFELFDKTAFWMRRYIETNFDPMFRWDFQANAKQVYRSHYNMVRREISSDKLLEWRVEDGWKPLCEFLGKPVPDMPFPSGNTTAEILPRVEARTQMLKRKARTRIQAFFTVLSIGVICYSVFLAR